MIFLPLGTVLPIPIWESRGYSLTSRVDLSWRTNITGKGKEIRNQNKAGMILKEKQWELSSTLPMYDSESIQLSCTKKESIIQQNIIAHVEQSQKHTD